MARTVDWAKVEPVFSSHPRVVAAWGFGSARAGTVREGGDLDVGVLFASPPGLDELADLREALQRALGFEDVDLVPLNRTGSTLRFEAVSGRPLYCRDLARRAAFVSLAAREHEDEATFHRRALAGRPAPLAARGPDR